MNIGFFDSGFGGKILADYFKKQHPWYDVVIRDDRENVPYGDKDEKVLHRLLVSNVAEMFDNDSLVIIVACNTLSVKLVRRVQDEMIQGKYSDRKILGVVVPTVEEIMATPGESFLVLGTHNTVCSGRYHQEIMRVDSHKTLVEVSGKNLASLIEFGEMRQAEKACLAILENEFSKKAYDAVVLACTHYAALKDFLRTVYPEKTILSQDEIISKKLADYLDRHDDLNQRLLVRR